MEKIKLREAEYITVQQALEWLAMGWIPYIDNDERLTTEDRENIRGYFNGEKIRVEDEHFYTDAQLEYCKKMYMAVGALENLLNKQVITLNANYIRKSLVSEVEEIIKNDVFLNFSLWFGGFNEERFYISAESFLLDEHFLIDDLYCLNFSELKKFEPLFMDNSQNVQKSGEAVNTENYTTPELQIINTIINKYSGNEINRQIKQTVLEWIETTAKELKITLSKNSRDAIFQVIRSEKGKKGGFKQML